MIERRLLSQFRKVIWLCTPWSSHCEHRRYTKRRILNVDTRGYTRSAAAGGDDLWDEGAFSFGLLVIVVVFFFRQARPSS